jgi:hypothetical protein
MLIVAATAARVTVREAYLARRPTAMAPVTIPSTPSADILTRREKLH